jgi:hypothetical protein
VPHADNPSVVHDTNPHLPRSRCIYIVAIVVPLVVLALVAAFGGDSSRHVSELPGGGVLEWIYPRSAIQEVVVYSTSGRRYGYCRRSAGARQTIFSGCSGERR